MRYNFLVLDKINVLVSGFLDLPIDIKRIQANKGKLEFVDLSLLFHFAAKIHGLKGALQPFNLRNDTNVAMNFRNLEMTELTPYTAEFSGRKITIGKLFLDFIYDMEKSQFKGENNIIPDNFIFG